MPTKKATLTLAISIAVSLLEACGSNSGTIGGGQTGYTNGNLKGTYTFLAIGEDTTGPPLDQYEVGGVLVADGNGAVTGGEQTYSDTVATHADSVTGTYSIASNGLGTITLQTGDASIGVNGTETFSVVILSPSKGLISEVDTSATSSGTLELQTSTAMPAAGYAFSVLGATIAGNTVLAFGGVFNIDNNPSTGSISGAGSVTDLAEGGSNAMNLPLSGSVSAPDSMGKVSVELSAGFTNAPISFDGYIVNATRMQLVENDGFATSAGTAFGQGAATGTYTTAASFTGPYVFGFDGFNLSGYGTYAGVMTSNGVNDLTGQIDQVQGPTAISDTLTGTYTIDASGTGRVATSTAFGNATNGAGPTMIFYLAGAGNPIPVLQVDTKARSAGTAYVQSSGTPSFSGTYGAGYTSATLFTGEQDVNATITSSGGSFSGMANEDLNFVPASNQSISGSIGSGSNGRFPGTISTNGTSAPCAFYFIDSTQAVFIQTDGNRATWGNIRQQAAP